jgi:uncharacterized membrane protein
MSLGTRFVLWLLSAVFAALMGIQSLARYGSFHNRTYDLALYARQAWGLAHGQFWDPIVNAHFLGTHIALVLWPLGWLGREFGTVRVLLVAQALAFGLATLPLAQIGARRFGDAGALCSAVAWLLYPNLSHVASYEFHPGSLGVLPMALALDALDRRRSLGFALAGVALLACRADFAFATALLGVLGLLPVRPALLLRTTHAGRRPTPTPAANGGGRKRAQRRVKVAAAGGLLLVSISYLALQFLWLGPHFWPQLTSMDLHFARWGGSPLGIVRALFREPSSVFAHFSEPRRLLYVPSVLLPLAFLPLFSPRWLLITLPFLAINLISTFPTTLEMYSHYLTPAVPALVVGALDGLSQLATRVTWPRLPALGLLVVLVLSVLTNLRSGGLPWSRGFDAAAFAVDDYTRQAAHVVAAIPADAAVQAPDPLLPHLAERARLYRAPPPDRNADFVVLDISQRTRYARQEVLLRTLEEPLARSWLARRDYGMVLAETSLILLARGESPRGGVALRYLTHESENQSGITLTRCLSVLSAWLDPHGIEFELAAHAPCPADLALRIGTETTPKRVDLMFDGLLSPANLRDENVLSWHALDERERARILERGLRVGALRSSGAPPEQGDPVSIPIPLIH